MLRARRRIRQTPARVFAFVAAVLGATAASAFDPVAELHNYAKQRERFLYGEVDAGYQANLLFGDLLGLFDPVGVLLRDPSRRPLNACAMHLDACRGDPRISDWGGRQGLMLPVAWVNRNGATISGHLWAPFPDHSGARLPGIVVTTGDTEAPEQIYWWAAQVLAAHGYVVLTWDPQGHGESDTIGSGDDTTTDVVLQQSSDAGDQAALDEEFATEIGEALDFLLSTRDDPYLPARPAAEDKQRTNARDGLVNGYDPLYGMLDPTKIGLAGHSRGAFATSIVGSRDTRVGAIVGWDNLTAGGPNRLSPDDTLAPLTPRVPALGIASEYYVGDPPYSAAPDPEGNNDAFATHRAARLDAMEVTIRGGTHFEYSFLPDPAFTATLRGIDVASWYTLAWFDKELKHDDTADARLLSDRWRDDAAGAAVDLDGDGNLFSWHYRSRLGFRLESDPLTVVTCDDLRTADCGLVDQAEDGGPASYSFLTDRGS